MTVEESTMEDAVTAVVEVGVGHADATKLRAAQRAEIAARYGDIPRTRLDNDDVMTTFFIATVDGIPAGCGGIEDRRDGSGQVKDMYVTPAHRGTGIAPQILAAIEGYARDHAIERLVLETGVRQPDAMRFYERGGYRRIENFGAYAGDDLSVCYEKQL